MKSIRQKKAKTSVDIYFLYIVLILLTFGLIMCFSASAPSAQYTYGDSFFFLRKQAINAALGLGAMFVASKYDYHKLGKLANLILIGSIVLLIIVLLIPGEGTKGAKRWFNIAGLSFQPSEVAKLAVIIWMSYQLSIERNRKKLGKFMAGFMPYMVVVGLFAGLLMLEPHFSCTVLVFVTSIIILFVAGAKISHFGMIGMPVIPLGAYLIMSGGYRVERVVTFLNPFSDPSDAGYQIIQSLYAIGSGGLFGLGLGKSRQKFLYIPEPHNDFIFAVLCEELGFVGAMLVIALFVMLIWRGIHIAMNAPDMFGSLMASGITGLIAIQVIINIAVVTSSMPVTGMPLPFFSAGGTSLIFTLVAMGIMLNISRKGKQHAAQIRNTKS